MLSIIRALGRSRYRPVTSNSDELPTISVCIPARNETHAMTRCLEAVLASRYEKLEILVLDDNSGDDTSVLIKSFAHAGVRFISGDPLPRDWLGKNYALSELLGEASGSLVLFMDVDTYIESDTIEQAVRLALSQHLALLSVVPQRNDVWRPSALFGSLRYLWVLLFSSKTQPSASAAFWLVDRSKLQQIGDFDAYKSAAQPEIHIARRLKAAGQTSQLVISNRRLGITYEKRWRSIKENGIRLLQPTFGGRLQALLVGCGLLLLVITPIVGVISVFVNSQNGLLALIALVSLIGLLLGAYAFYRASWRRGAVVGALLLPYMAMQEVWFIILSVIGHARGTLTWKDRKLTSID